MGRIQGLSAENTNPALMLWELLIEVKNEVCSEENIEDPSLYLFQTVNTIFS